MSSDVLGKETFTVPVDKITAGYNTETCSIGLMVETKDDCFVFCNGITHQNAEDIIRQLRDILNKVS